MVCHFSQHCGLTKSFEDVTNAIMKKKKREKTGSVSSQLEFTEMQKRAPGPRSMIVFLAHSVGKSLPWDYFVL